MNRYRVAHSDEMFNSSYRTMDCCLTSCFEVEFKPGMGDRVAYGEGLENGGPSEENCGFESRSLRYQHSWRLFK